MSGKGTVSAPYVLARGAQYEADGEYRKAFFDYMRYDSLMNNNASADFYYTKYKCEMKIRQYQPALNDIAHAICDAHGARLLCRDGKSATPCQQA